MKKIAVLLLMMILGYFLFTNLYSTSVGNLNFPKYGEVNLKNRVSDKYIKKDVKGTEKETIYGQKGMESGAANVVTSIVVDYRSFDTLGEVTVLFISALGVSLVMGVSNKKKRFTIPSNFILKQGARIIYSIILVTGVYMFIHGHLTPGGGFPGGSMIASSFLLMYIAEEDFKVKFEYLKITEGIAGSAYVLIGLLGMLMGGYFLINILPNGSVGALLSAGIIPIVYTFIGLKVGAELTGIIGNFLSEEVEK